MSNSHREYVQRASLSQLQQISGLKIGKTRCDVRLEEPGADPGILVGGGVDFFFQRHGAWGRLKAPNGSRATQWCCAQGAKPPEAPEFK